MIEILKQDLKKISEKVDEITYREHSEESNALDEETIKDLNNLFSDKELLTTIDKISAYNNNEAFNYEILCEIEESLVNIAHGLRSIKNRVDMDIFFKDGYTLDIEKIEKKFKKQGLRKKYPNLNFKRLKELYEKPPAYIQTYYSDEQIKIDEYVFRKYVIALIQMVLDEMDLVVAVVGGEGSGKSTHVSQLMYMVQYLLLELGIIENDFKIKNTFFNTLEKLREKEDDFFDVPFRIFALDEGNQLHRNNWREEEVQTFFQRLRRERYNQRIKFICLPVLGELMPNITLSRVNFIHEMQNTNDTKTGSLNKGKVNFYIIPRGVKIFSPAQRKEIYRFDIKQALQENLKDKNYLAGMPRDILIKEYNCNGTWGFPRSEYIEELKQSNRTFTINEGLKLSNWEVFCLYKANISLKAIGISSKDPIYATANKSLNKIKNFLENDVDKFNKLSLQLERKTKEKELKQDS